MLAMMRRGRRNWNTEANIVYLSSTTIHREHISRSSTRVCPVVSWFPQTHLCSNPENVKFKLVKLFVLRFGVPNNTETFTLDFERQIDTKYLNLIGHNQ